MNVSFIYFIYLQLCICIYIYIFFLYTPNLRIFKASKRIIRKCFFRCTEISLRYYDVIVYNQIIPTCLLYLGSRVNIEETLLLFFYEIEI